MRVSRRGSMARKVAAVVASGPTPGGLLLREPLVVGTHGILGQRQLRNMYKYRNHRLLLVVLFILVFRVNTMDLLVK